MKTLRSARRSVIGDACGQSFTAAPRLHDEFLTIDTPVVDSEGCLVFEVGIADNTHSSASETLKPVVSAILTEAFLGTSGPLATGVFTTISATGQALNGGGIR
jgi:hypothetical protein